MEAEMVEKFIVSTNIVNSLGNRSELNCPDCGGVLWEMEQGVTLRYVVIQGILIRQIRC
jgi:two-component system chemotaxis response regulator CheB